MSESCKNCIFLSMGKCTSEYLEGIDDEEFLTIENPENSKCEFYEDCR